MLKEYKIVAIYIFLVIVFASWDNCNVRIGNFAKLVHKFDNNLKKYWIGFNLVFENVQWFEVENFDYLNCSIIWFDLIQKSWIDIENWFI